MQLPGLAKAPHWRHYRSMALLQFGMWVLLATIW
jgi:hypothetical protein